MKAELAVWPRPRPSRPGGHRGVGRSSQRRHSKTGSSRTGTKSRQAARARIAALRRASYLVMIPAVLLLLLGLVMVLSSGSVIGLQKYRSSYYYFFQQLLWAALGVGALFILRRLDYHKLGRVSFLATVISLGMLVAVLMPSVGSAAGGSRRWLVIGPVSMQPTELVKFSIIVFSAYALATKKNKLRNIKHLIVPVVLVTAVAMIILLLQPDMGSALVLGAAVLTLLFVSRSRPGHVFLLAGVGSISAIALAMAKPYRKARLISFWNPWSSPRGSGYQVIQSYIALGSGSIKGVGLGMSRQKFWYLPNSHTDFIFAVIGEELGILGTMSVVCLMVLLVYGGLRIAQKAPDEMGRLLAMGITSLIGIQALVNMAGVTGLLPITGVPLPLVSFGGSSLCVCLGAIGILMSIARQGKKRARGGRTAASRSNGRRNRRARVS